MATLTGLALLTLILIINLSQCSFKPNAMDNGVGRLNPRLSNEKELQKHDNQNDDTVTGKPELNSSVGRQISKSSNCLPYKYPQEARNDTNSTSSRHYRSSTVRANFRRNRFKESNRRSAVVPNYSLEQENRDSLNKENRETNANISLPLHDQHLEDSDTSEIEFIRDASNKENRETNANISLPLHDQHLEDSDTSEIEFIKDASNKGNRETNANISLPEHDQHLEDSDTSETEFNRDALNREHRETNANISLPLHDQHLEDGDASEIEYIDSDYYESDFSRLQDVDYGDTRKSFLQRNGKDDSKRQDAIKTAISEAIGEQKEAREGTTHQQRRDILSAHNSILNSLEYASANSVFIVYSLQLEQASFLWAKQCDRDAAFPSFGDFHFDKSDIGLNSGANETYSWDLMIKEWKSGQKGFDVINSRCLQGNRRCRNYVRMVWASTSHLGCSVAFCPVYYSRYKQQTNIYNYACYYVPSGNVRSVGKHGMQLSPYIRGPPSSQCPPDHPVPWGNFCRTDPPCKDVRECEYPKEVEYCLCDESYYTSGQESIIPRWTLLDLAVIVATVAYSCIYLCS